MSSDEIKRIDIAEFRALGFLQEVNRRLLHPCGLALEVVTDEDGTERLGGVWDYRDDPEGIVFTGVTEAMVLAARSVDAELAVHAPARYELLGCAVQPLDSPWAAADGTDDRFRDGKDQQQR